jgi:hypothetical protein
VVSKPDFKKLQVYIFIGFGICLAFHVIYPNAIDFRPEITQRDLLSRVMAGMYSMETSTMVTPSMHVFSAVAVHIALVKSRVTGRSKKLIALSFLAMSLICASTVFVKQHSIIDVFWGIVLAAVLYIPIYGFGNNKAASRC